MLLSAERYVSVRKRERGRGKEREEGVGSKNHHLTVLV